MRVDDTNIRIKMAVNGKSLSRLSLCLFNLSVWWQCMIQHGGRFGRLRKKMGKISSSLNLCSLTSLTCSWMQASGVMSVQTCLNTQKESVGNKIHIYNKWDQFVIQGLTHLQEDKPILLMKLPRRIQDLISTFFFLLIQMQLLPVGKLF